MPKCPKCNTVKDSDLFYRNKSRKSGQSSWCKSCGSKYGKAARTTWRTNNPEKMKKYQKEFECRSPERVLFNRTKNRAKRIGIAFNLELSDIVIPEVCPILGIVLEKGVGRMCDASPSLDKNVPKKGYTKGNVEVISMRANRIKTDASAKELRLVARYVERINAQHS